MYRLKEIKIRENLSDEEVVKLALRKYRIAEDSINRWRIYRKSIDARNKSDVHFVYTIDVEFVNESLAIIKKEAPYQKLLEKRYHKKNRRIRTDTSNS